jgi:hypothetical protein
MNMLFRCALRLFAVGAFVIVLAPASASDVEQTKRLKLAMGPMSAAQKNQGGAVADAAPVEPRHHWHRHRHHIRSPRS